MAEYSDLAEIDRLSKQQELIAQALLILEEYNGTISNYTVAPVFEPNVMGTPNIMPTMINTGTVSEDLLVYIHENLVLQYDDLSQQLAALGVTGVPPAHTGALHATQEERR